MLRSVTSGRRQRICLARAGLKAATASACNCPPLAIPSESTVRFGLDGTEYEIDLNAEHARALRDGLARYVSAARRAGGGARRPARGGRRVSASGLDTTEVCERAKAQGIEVKDRGRVPAEVAARFRAATGK
jgi:nucleoid-associated protein Lsr2